MYKIKLIIIIKTYKVIQYDNRVLPWKGYNK